MQLKRELKHFGYTLAAFMLFTISAIAHTVVLWVILAGVLILIFEKIENLFEVFIVSILMILPLLMIRYFPYQVLSCSKHVTNFLNIPARYGLHLLDRINQENMTPNRDK